MPCIDFFFIYKLLFLCYVFVSRVEDDIALTYNDNACLENYHVGTLFLLLKNHPEANILQNLTSKERADLRFVVIFEVLVITLHTHGVSD
jgi:hypothetical protein